MVKIFTCMVLMAVFLPVLAISQSPMISYQGKLTDAGGEPLNTTVSIQFSIYSQSSGGTAVWTETQSSVSVNSGVFNVLLGSVTPIPNSVFTGSDRWLGLKVGGDAEMTPRQQIVSVGYALRSGKSTEAESADNCDFATDADMIDGQHASEFLSMANDWGRSGVATDLYEGSSTLNDRYVNETGPEEITANSGDPAFVVNNTGFGRGIEGYSRGSYSVYGENLDFGTNGHLACWDYGAYGQYNNYTNGHLGGPQYGAYGEHNTGTFGCLGAELNGVYGESSTGHYGLLGGFEIAVEGHYDEDCWGYIGDGATGVFGRGPSKGVYGMSDGSSGWGVHGRVTASSLSLSAHAIHGEAPALAYAGYFDGNARVTDNLSCGGNFTCSGTKSFVARHPEDRSKKIVYVSLEGPEAGTYCRGTSNLTNGQAVIHLPDHFHLVTEDEGITVLVTPTSACKGLMVTKMTPAEIIVQELGGGTSNATFTYFVNGVRQGYTDFEVVRDIVPSDEFDVDSRD